MPAQGMFVSKESCELLMNMLNPLYHFFFSHMEKSVPKLKRKHVFKSFLFFFKKVSMFLEIQIIMLIFKSRSPRVKLNLVLSI